MKYIIYNSYPAQNAQALLSSSQTLFEYLGLEQVQARSSLADCGGYWARIVQREDLVRNVAYNLALANGENATLVFLEEDSYANVYYARTLIESNPELMKSLQEDYLHRFNVIYDSKVQMVYLPDLLNSLEFSSLIQKRFVDFQSVIVRGAYQGHLPKSTNHRIYKEIGLEIFDTPLSQQYYAHLAKNNPGFAYHHSGKLFFEMADLGVDFILSYSLSQQIILDEKRKNLCVAYNRDNIAIPVLFLPQVILLALGESDISKLGFDKHHQKVNLL